MKDEILTSHEKLMKVYYEKNRGKLVQLIHGKKPKIQSEVIKKFKKLYPDVEIMDIKSLFWEGYNKALDNIVSEDNTDAFNRGYNYAYSEMNDSNEDIDDCIEKECKESLDIDEINAEFERLANEDMQMEDYYGDYIFDYKSGFDDGYSEGYDKGYHNGLNDSDSYHNSKSSSDDYDEGYKDGYEAGLEARPSDDSAFNGYYGADGGFHEYNNGWEGE